MAPRQPNCWHVLRSFRCSLRPGPHTREAPEADVEAALEWSERLLRAHTGDGEFSMLRALLADLPRRRTHTHAHAHSGSR